LGSGFEIKIKENVDDEYKAIVADFYPRIAGQMYSIEVEQDDRGGMAVRIFKYVLAGRCGTA
jgi:hypothetical protein